DEPNLRAALALGSSTTSGMTFFLPRPFRRARFCTTQTPPDFRTQCRLASTRTTTSSELEVSPNKKWVAYSDAAMRIGEIQDWGGTPPKRIVIPDPRGPSVNVHGMLNHSWSRPFWLSDTRLATSPPGGQKGLPSGGLNPETFIFDIPSGEIVAQLEVEEQVRHGFAFDRERSILYGSCMNGDILGWDVSSVL
ncbi:MAG: hypothetical protein AAFX94_18880, partial [Myxococcota bacterium]